MNYSTALQNPIFKIIAQASNELDLESYVIGGFVRDILLKRDFKKDIDVVAIGSGIDLALKVSDLLPNKPKVQVFKTYGNILIKCVFDILRTSANIYKFCQIWIDSVKQ